MTDTDYMNLALIEAKKALKLKEIPIGAILVYQNSIIASAHNLCESLPDATAHAEILAIKKASKTLHNWRLTGSTLYVTIEPCPMCAGAIINSRISRVVYGSANTQYGTTNALYPIKSFSKWDTGITIISGIEETKCRELMNCFFNETR